MSAKITPAPINAFAAAAAIQPAEITPIVEIEAVANVDETAVEVSMDSVDQVLDDVQEHQPAVVKDFVLGQLPEDLETEISEVARAIFDTNACMKADHETLAHLQGVETWLLEEKSRRDAGQSTAVMAYLAAQSASQ
ncbi:hypothetical protein [uncultured Deefgea sp.]|uniref:hypothetical protein n=1 Tax=uncultured Deefgea sp. TaxID=1304914 RepID=UPI0026372DB3|nr:hypothetical protein [uncultured Deefgea sp.]